MLLKSHFKSIQTQQHVNWSATNGTSCTLFAVQLIVKRCEETLMAAWNQRDACVARLHKTHRSSRQHQLQPSEALRRHFRLRRKARYGQHRRRRL